MKRRKYYSGWDTENAMSIAELQHMAWRRTPNFALEYLEGGAEDELSLKQNQETFSRFAFVPRALVPVGRVDMSTTLLGQTVPVPFLIGPTGFAGLFARDGDRCLARAAAEAGIPFVQSTVSNASIEEVAAVPGVRHWMQLYIFRSRTLMEQLLERIMSSGSNVLVVTTDGSVFGNREWDRRNYKVGFNLTLRNKLDLVFHPRWAVDVLAKGVPTFANLVADLPVNQRSWIKSAGRARDEIEPNLDWTHIAWLRRVWPGKLVLKGILSMEDAQIARDHGVDGIVVTNHGGRQLDGAIAPIEVLAEIADRHGREMTILIDGGFRRGSDIAKALALGAHGVLLGRAPLYGLAAGGERGVARALTVLTDELRRTLALLGRPMLDMLDRSSIRRI